MYCGTSRNLRSAARLTMSPVSSRGPYSSSWGVVDGADLFRGLADEREEDVRRRPSDEAREGFRDFVTRDERARLI